MRETNYLKGGTTIKRIKYETTLLSTIHAIDFAMLSCSPCPLFFVDIVHFSKYLQNVFQIIPWYV